MRINLTLIGPILSVIRIVGPFKSVSVSGSKFSYYTPTHSSSTHRHTHTHITPPHTDTHTLLSVKSNGSRIFIVLSIIIVTVTEMLLSLLSSLNSLTGRTLTLSHTKTQRD